jgi:hypothetical protein
MSEPTANARPLAAEVDLIDAAEPIEVSLDVESQSPAASLQSVLRVTEIVEAAINAGMFPAQRTTPEETACDVLATEGELGAVRKIWRMTGVAPGAYKILLSMLAVVHKYQVPLSALRLRSAPARGSRLTLAEITAVPYPKRTDDVRFEVKLPRIRDELTSPRIRIIFADDIGDSALDLFEHTFTAWDHLITHGGYFHVADELELDDENVLGETYMLSENTVEHTLEADVGSPEAFDAVINMAVKVHKTLHRVVRFELE